MRVADATEFKFFCNGIPIMTERLFKGLSKTEYDNAASWYEKFTPVDKQNIEDVLDAFKRWTKSTLSDGLDTCNASYRCYPFFVVYAIGSTITEKPDPTDIDLLAVTNVWVSEKEWCEPKISKFVKRLKASHAVSVDDMVTERYDHEVDCRVKLDIRPLKQPSKEIDLIYQYDILTRSRWEQNDEFDRIPLLAIGDSEKNDCTYYVPGQDGGWALLPMTVYRITTQRRPRRHW